MQKKMASTALYKHHMDNECQMLLSELSSN